MKFSVLGTGNIDADVILDLPAVVIPKLKGDTGELTQEQQESVNRAIQSYDVAILADLKATPFQTRVDAEFAEIPSVVDFINVAGKVMFNYSGDLEAAVTMLDGRKFMPASLPSPYDFGAVCNGIVDDTEALRKLHLWCNSAGVTPDYSKVLTFAIQSNASIRINTSVDFCGARIVVINGMVDVPQFGTQTTRNAFIIEDPQRLVVSSAGVAVDGIHFALNSRSTCETLIPGAGWVYFQLSTGTSLPQISERTPTSSVNYGIANKVYSDLTTQHPLNVDASGVTSVNTEYRLNPALGWIDVGNIVVDVTQFNRQAIFRVERNMVEIWGLITEAFALPPDSINELIKVYKCSDVRISKSSGIGLRTTQNLGTYVLNMNWVAGITIEQCDFRGSRSLNYWGVTASNWSNGITYIDCNLDRIDIHAYSINKKVFLCEIGPSGITYGQGGGFLIVSDCLHWGASAQSGIVVRRGDYGGQWDGTMSVSDCQISGAPFTATVINMAEGPVGNTTVPLSLPKTIRISGITVSGRNDENVVRPLSLSIRADAAAVTPFSHLTVDGIVADRNFMMGMPHMLADCGPSATGGVTIDISNVAQTGSRLDTPNISIPVRTVASGTDSFIQIQTIGLRNAHFSLPGVAFSGSRMKVVSGGLRRTVSTAALTIEYVGVNFLSPLLAGGETVAPICATMGGTRFCSVVGGNLAGAYDFSKVTGASGVLTQAASIGAAVLPASVTREQMFTGWMA